MAAIVDKNKCEGCQACIPVCPTDAIAMKDGKAEVDPDACLDCGGCEAACPTKAITLP
jgi:ferredoxin